MKCYSRMKRVVVPIARKLKRRRRLAAMAALVDAGLPGVLIKPTQYLITGEAPSHAESARKRVEAQRQRIAARGDEKVDVLYSPKPGSSGEQLTPDMRPEHGQVMQFTLERLARTGKGAKWGTFLHLLADEVGGTLLELGSCAGISAAYLGTAPSCERLMTVEGSSSLALLARETTEQVVPGKVEVITGLFDDALDKIIPALGPRKLDFVFIDGHHERIATLHYFDRVKPVLRPGSVVVFDDVSWSSDMREMWDDVARQPGVADAADFGAVGVIVWDPGSTTQRYWDLQPLLGKREIGEPWGWKA